MDVMKAKRAKMDIDEILENVNKEDFGKPAVTEHLKNLVKLHTFYEAECVKEGYVESSMRGMGRSMYPDNSMAMDMSGRRVRAANGQWASGAGGESYDDFSYGSPKEQLRRWANDPSLSYEAKEYLRKAMENMR